VSAKTQRHRRLRRTRRRSETDTPYRRSHEHSTRCRRCPRAGVGSHCNTIGRNQWSTPTAGRSWRGGASSESQITKAEREWWTASRARFSGAQGKVAL